MAQVNKPTRLNEQEIKFCNHWAEVIKNKHNITSDQLDKASQLSGGVGRSGNCSSCLRNDAINFNNKYKRLYNFYQEYLKEEEVKKVKKVVKKRTTKKKVVKKSVKKDIGKDIGGDIL